MSFPHTFMPVGRPDGSYQPMTCCHCGKGYIDGNGTAPVESCPAFVIKESEVKEALDRVRGWGRLEATLESANPLSVKWLRFEKLVDEIEKELTDQKEEK